MRLTLLLFTLLCAACTQLFLYPSKQQVLHPEKLGLKYDDVFLPMGDGLRLHGWYLHAKGRPKGTLLHLHGNAENISTFIAPVHWLPSRGYNVLLLDYSGYGKSEGVATVPGVHRDAKIALEYLLSRPGPDSESLVVFGQSLGGAVGIYTVAHSPQRERVKAVISEGAFSGYARIAREKMNLLWLTWPLQWPLSFLFSDEFSPEDAAAGLSPVPLLLIHGDADTIVPYSHSRILYGASQEPRELWTVPGGQHVDALAKTEMRERFVAYLEKVLRPAVRK